jgi:lipopolysaccharide transport system ATP-binding protein
VPVTAALQVERLSKRYQIGMQSRGDGSFRDAVASFVRAPLRRFRALGGTADEGWFWALKDLSFAVPPGEVTAVIGRNGAGKSTLLKILSRITEPSAGRVELRGRVASLLEVGTGFHPDLTGRENVYLNGAILGMRRAEIRSKFDEIVDFAEVSRFIDTPVKHYSSGMYLRLAFSVAAHLEGEVLLVDEVLAVGDVAFQQKCLGKMQDVSRGGRTVVFISHNMSAVASLCSRAIVLDRGSRVFDGPAGEGIRHYLAQHLDDRAARWDLDRQPRVENDLGRSTRLLEMSAHVDAASGFRFGTPMRFRVAFATTTPLRHLVCAINIDDLTGRRIVSFESDEAALHFNAVTAGRYAVEVEAPPFGLRPGKYLLSASLYSGGQFYDYVVQFGVVSVLSPESGRHRVELEERADRGPIHVESKWRVVAAEQLVTV